MPSLDTIRTVTVRGQQQGVNEATSALDQLTASIRTANDNLRQSQQLSAAANDGFTLTGAGALTAANHLRQAAEAAYAFSPAFRGVVNELAVPALGSASTALTAVAGGIVTASNYAGTGLVALAGAAEKVSPNFVGLTSTVRSAGLAMEAFSPSVATVGASVLGVAGTIVSRFLPVVGQVILLYDGIKALGDAWEYGKEKLAEYVVVAQQAAQSDVSTDFLQRITKAATDAKIPVDGVTAALKALNDATADKLGGSTGQKRLDELTEAGNFKGNTGVAELGQANNTEDRLRAISSLIDQAVDKGQRLAALDVAKTFLGDQVAANLAKDSTYLDKLLASADAVSQTDLIPQAQIDNAVALQNRMDAAVAILEQRWHPIQDLLTQLGIQMQGVWVSIVETIAKAVSGVFDLVSAIGTAIGKAADFVSSLVPPWLRTLLERVAGAGAGLAVGTIPGLAVVGAGITAYSLNGGSSDAGADPAMAAARARLASQMGNPTNVANAGALTRSIQSTVRGDTSLDPNAKGPDTSAYDRAVGSIEKYVQTTNAAAGSVSDAAGEQEKFKAVAELTAAAIKDGTPITADLAAKMQALGDRAGAAADALAKAKVANQIDFNSKTAFLSQDDVAIATQLKGIYGNDIPQALGSTYAAGIRVNTAMKDISSAIETNLTSGLTDIVSGTKSVSQGFSDMGQAVAKAVEQMAIKIAIIQPLMQSLQAGANSLGISSFGSTGAGGIFGALGITYGVPGTSGSNLFGPAAPSTALHAGGIVGSEATFRRYVHPAYFDDAPRFHTGGIAGDEVPIIARKGEGVFTPGQMAALGKASAPQVNVVVNESPNAAGSVTQKQNSNGGIDIAMTIAQYSAKGAATPGNPLNKVLRNQLGANPRLTGR